MPQPHDPSETADPSVSVVIPARARCAPLRNCLDALCRQTFEDFEIIVVDDASSDGTAAMLESFRRDHPNPPIRLIRNERQSGANASRNKAIRSARGALIAFLDSDCVPYEQWLEELIRPFGDPSVASATGRIINPEPTNPYELTLKGLNRADGATEARRLVGCNMCIRRRLLLENPLDEDLLYGCDEEGIFLRLRAAGYSQRFVSDAPLLHEHHYDRRAFFRLARVGGAAAAWLVYKYRLPARLDMLPFLLTAISLPFGLLWPPALFATGAFFLGGLAALVYNDLFLKRKTLFETIRTFPLLLAYYAVRFWSYTIQSLRLRLTPHNIRRVRL